MIQSEAKPIALQSHNARYAKLRRQVGEVQFNVLEVRDWLRQCGYSDIVCERQNLPLPIRCAKKINKVLNIDFRLIKGDTKLPLGAKVFLVLRVVWNVGNLPQRSTYRDNHIATFRNRPRKRSRFFFCHKFCDVITYSQSCKVGTVNNREARGYKTFDFKIRSERTRCDIFDVVAYSAFSQFHWRAIA